MSQRLQNGSKLAQRLLHMGAAASRTANVRRQARWSSSSSDGRRPANRAGIVSMVLAAFGTGVFLTKFQAQELPQLTRPAYADRDGMLRAAKEISNLLGEDAVTYDSEVLEHHGHSDWSTANSPTRAVAVTYPRSTDDVSVIARICSKHNVPMVPFGAGSSVEGNFSQPHSGICIDTSFMDQIVAFHPEDMDVVVQPGVNWMDLNAKVASSGLFAPMDPSPTATVGGMVSTNCSGTNAMRYGTMKDWVLNLTVVLPDGSVIKTRRRPRKTSAGYNLTSLFVGAEGTLGIVTEVTLKLATIPQDTSVAVVAFPTIKAASAAASALVRTSGVQLAALEIMDDVQMRMLNEHGSATVRKRRWAEKPTLFLKFSGTKEAVQSDMKSVTQFIKPYTTETLLTPQTKQDEHDLWAARKEGLFTMVNNRPPGTQLWSTDVAVPLSRLAEIIDKSKEECSQLGIFASVVGHVGDGNFHVAMFYDPKNSEQSAKVTKVVKDMMKRALEMEGTVSGEHAIGIGKKDCLVDELGPETIDLMKTLKKAVDPKWLMNPGKVFDP
ncbi:hypothetical protein B0I35DRAFT_427639 [Stachybotrys elegans]|uniref:D-lactate dehydrogenase (cytochrome) n=1 Tax=Stachybotrys elegans TaxID=80388 RepID=A0A8K0SXP6_9HYPO|nr:hypothetical protein B0I35DRAFT_427639 [Stachybotrys elegans]